VERSAIEAIRRGEQAAAEAMSSRRGGGVTTAKGPAADARGAPTSEGRGTGPAVGAVALGRFEHLYEISKLLADFRGIDETLPRVLEIANDVIPLHGAILIADGDNAPATLAWPKADPVDERQLRLLERARACHAYFAGAGGGTAAEGEGADRGRIIALPLVVDHQRVFGVLQLEPAALDEASLFFLNALTNQVAVAIDRHRAWQHDRELRHEAELQRARAQDLEGRHRAVAEALRESEERRRLATEGTGIGTWDYDPATKVSTCDATCHALIGLAPEARVDLDVIVSAAHPEDRARMLDALARALEPASGGALDIEHRLIGLLDGVERWVYVRGRAYFEEGRPVRLLGTAVDVTARKRAEEALRLSESRFAGIVSLAADAIISSDEAQRITLFNEAAEAMFGYRRDEVLGEPLNVLLPEPSRAAHDANLQRFALDPRQGRAMGGRMEVRGRRKDGEEFPAEASISKLAVDGRWIFTVMLRDITAPRRVEEGRRLLAEAGAVLAGSLEHEEETLTRVAELSVQFLADCCMVDVVGDDARLRRLAVAHTDPAKRDLATDLSRVELDRRRPSPAFRAMETQRSVLLPDVPPDFVASIAQDEDHQRMLQALGPRSAMVVPLVARGRALGVMVFVRSTTRRRYDPKDLGIADDLARHAAFAVDNAHLYRAAQRAIRDRDEILGVVAHDLRTPLHAIALAANLLSMGGPPDERDPARSKLGRIVRSTEQMNRLIDDLLDVTRIEAGRLSVMPAPHAAGELVAEAADAAGGAVSAASLALETAVEEGLPTILVDPDRILQVFSNLISNAIKFTASGGRVRIGAAREGAGVRFWVSDTGAGIAQESLRHIFDRFWQASARDRRGAGLGLPICKGIVEAHGGKLWAESDPGRGSTFTFRLPAVA
jgi:PAS domain S-box-containing protein